VVDWFRARRAVRFTAQGCEFAAGAPRGLPPLRVRTHRPGVEPSDISWDGNTAFEFQTMNPS
jgi:hypothetical protein